MINYVNLVCKALRSGWESSSSFGGVRLVAQDDIRDRVQFEAQRHPLAWVLVQAGWWDDFAGLGWSR